MTKSKIHIPKRHKIHCSQRDTKSNIPKRHGIQHSQRDTEVFPIRKDNKQTHWYNSQWITLAQKTNPWYNSQWATLMMQKTNPWYNSQWATLGRTLLLRLGGLVSIRAISYSSTHRNVFLGNFDVRLNGRNTRFCRSVGC